MSSEEQKKQLLAQKLFRNMKSKKKSLSNAKDEKNTTSTKNPKISSTKESEADLTR